MGENCLRQKPLKVQKDETKSLAIQTKRANRWTEEQRRLNDNEDELGTYNIYLPDELRAENENILMIKGDKSIRRKCH